MLVPHSSGPLVIGFSRTRRGTTRKGKEKQLRILDLFCGAGGASVGYNRAGFEVVGIDVNHQANYPFHFIRDDAIEFLKAMLRGGVCYNGEKWLKLADFDAIHASPPCQSSSALTKGTNAGKWEYPDFIPETRRLLDLTGKPYIIENVQGSAVRRDMVLCGEMFGLAVIRHRYFELGNWTAQAPQHIKHRGRVAGMRHGVWYTGPYFAVYGDGGGKGTIKQWQDAMEMPWTRVRKEIAEAIPPAYTEYIGKELTHYLEV